MEQCFWTQECHSVHSYVGSDMGQLFPNSLHQLTCGSLVSSLSKRYQTRGPNGRYCCLGVFAQMLVCVGWFCLPLPLSHRVGGDRELPKCSKLDLNSNTTTLPVNILQITRCLLHHTLLNFQMKYRFQKQSLKSKHSTKNRGK